MIQFTGTYKDHQVYLVTHPGVKLVQIDTPICVVQMGPDEIQRMEAV
jgi:hypothetical protein